MMLLRIGVFIAVFRAAGGEPYNTIIFSAQLNYYREINLRRYTHRKK